MMAERYTSRTLREIVRVLASRLLGMILLVVLVVAAVTAATIMVPKWYRSEVELRAKPSGMTSPLEAAPTSMRDEVSLFVRTQRQIITSDYVLAMSLMRLDGRALLSDAAETDRWYDDEAINAYLTANSELLHQTAKRVSVVTPGGPDATFTQTFTIRVDWPEERALAAKLGRDSRELAAERSYQLANYLTEAYLARYSWLESQAAGKAVSLLESDALEAARKYRDQAQEKLRSFIEKDLKGDLLHVINMVGKGGGGIETGVASLTRQFEGELTQIDAELARLRAMQKVIETELAKPDAGDVVVPESIAKVNPHPDHQREGRSASPGIERAAIEVHRRLPGSPPRGGGVPGRDARPAGRAGPAGHADRSGH
jgi:hypothetical protein